MEDQKPIRIKGETPSSPFVDTQRIPMSQTKIDLMKEESRYLQQESDRLLAEAVQLKKAIERYKRDRIFRTIIGAVIGAIIMTVCLTICFLARKG
jgi:hypothetical protein